MSIHQASFPLAICLESAHFTIHYHLRNQRLGRGQGSMGVTDLELLSIYQDGLERLYATLTSPPWLRPQFERRINVYVGDLAALSFGDHNPFVAVDQTNTPYIALPSRTNEPSKLMESLWAAAAAVHEATHIFNSINRPLLNIYSGLWAWFDEALAVFLEKQVLPENHDYLRHLGEWIAKPHLSLDDQSTYYQAERLLEYLAMRYGTAFINAVWVDSWPTETPLETLSRLLPTDQRFISTDPEVRDVFASGYCLDSWFLNDPASPAYAPELYARYGERALAESFELQTSQTVETTDMLDHLACRYYRFYLADEVREFRLELTPAEAQAQLKAELVSVTQDLRRGALTLPLRPLDTSRPVLAAQLEQKEMAEVDHFILVVTNCGTRAAQVNPARPHDDQKRYALKLTTR